MERASPAAATWPPRSSGRTGPDRTSFIRFERPAGGGRRAGRRPLDLAGSARGLVGTTAARSAWGSGRRRGRPLPTAVAITLDRRPELSTRRVHSREDCAGYRAPGTKWRGRGPAEPDA